MPGDIPHEIWHPLHVRSAKGESLTPEEQAILDEAYQQADEKHPLRSNAAEIRTARSVLNELIAKHQHNEQKWLAIQQEIQELESQLSPEQRAELGVAS